MTDVKFPKEAYFNYFLFTKSTTLLFVKFIFSSDIYARRFLSDFQKYVPLMDIFDAYAHKIMLLGVKFKKMDWFFIPVKDLPPHSDMTITRQKKYRFHVGFDVSQISTKVEIPSGILYLDDMDEPLENIIEEVRPLRRRQAKKIYGEWMDMVYTYPDLNDLAEKKVRFA